MDAIQLEILKKIAVQIYTCCRTCFDLSCCSARRWRRQKLFEGKVKRQKNRYRIVGSISQLLGGACIIEDVIRVNGNKR